MSPAAYNAFCASLPATSHVVQWGGADVWKVGGKVFALESELQGRACVSVKALPENVVHLVAGADGVGPGYHLNKTHWVTVDLARVDPGLAAELVQESHAIIVAKLPRRLRLALDAARLPEFERDPAVPVDRGDERVGPAPRSGARQTQLQCAEPVAGPVVHAHRPALAGGVDRRLQAGAGWHGGSSRGSGWVQPR